MATETVVYKAILTTQALETLQDMQATGDTLTIKRFEVSSTAGNLDPDRTMTSMNTTWFQNTIRQQDPVSSGLSLSLGLIVPAGVDTGGSPQYMTEFYIIAEYQEEEFLYGILQTQLSFDSLLTYVNNTQYYFSVVYDLEQYDGDLKIIIDSTFSNVLLPIHYSQDQEIELLYNNTLMLNNLGYLSVNPTNIISAEAMIIVDSSNKLTIDRTKLISEQAGNIIQVGTDGGLYVSDTNYATLDLSNITNQGAILEVGQPQITLSNNLNSNEIWLEGATVSRVTYSSLFSIYGTTYGAGDGSTTFTLPNFKGRAIWGSDSYGYISAGLPNITGFVDEMCTYSSSSPTGAFYQTSSGTWKKSGRDQTLYQKDVHFDASRSNSIYGNSTTVQPPAIKVRVKTRYK